MDFISFPSIEILGDLRKRFSCNMTRKYHPNDVGWYLAPDSRSRSTKKIWGAGISNSGPRNRQSFSVKLLPTRPVRWTTWWVCVYWPEPIDIPNFPSVRDPWVRSGALRSLIMESSIALCGRILGELNTPYWTPSGTFSGLSFCTLAWFCMVLLFALQVLPINLYICLLCMLCCPTLIPNPNTFQNKMRICLVGRVFFLDKSEYFFYLA